MTATATPPAPMTTCPKGCTRFRYTGSVRANGTLMEGQMVCEHGTEVWLPGRPSQQPPLPAMLKWSVEIERTLGTTILVEAGSFAEAEAAAKGLYGTDIETTDLEETEVTFNAVRIRDWPGGGDGLYWDGTDWQDI